MTSRLHLLLAATCALALIQLASGEDSNGEIKCTTQQQGDTNTSLIGLEPVILPPGVFDENILVTPPLFCRVRGVKVTVCDTAVAPDVRIEPTLSTITVRRYSNASENAFAYISVKCIIL
ncbi:uncharacterized protein LOC142985207 [Anticarsia gemmatalis]|uniref:uncharacterized protein LOC142985207 n=1 Tax=Anticarsia gemmatalis TaxID=129554 RepID=UPI003F758E66